MAVVAGVAVFAAVAGVQLARFRRLNGVWLGGFTSRVVLGTATAASVSYAVALGAAIWAAYGERWWLVALWSSVGGAALRAQRPPLDAHLPRRSRRTRARRVARLARAA